MVATPTFTEAAETDVTRRFRWISGSEIIRRDLRDGRRPAAELRHTRAPPEHGPGPVELDGSTEPERRRRGVGRSGWPESWPRTGAEPVRTGTNPVELLLRSLTAAATRSGGGHEPLEAAQLMLESYGNESRKLLPPSGGRWEEAPRRNPAPGRAGSPEPGPVPYADLCSQENRACCSSGRTDPGGGRRSSSWTPGGPRLSSPREVQLQELAADIRRRTRITVPERDRRMAALLLGRHQEAQERLELSHLERQKREEARRRQEEQQVQAEEERRRKLKRSVTGWHRQQEARRRRREQEEQERIGQLRQEATLLQERWRRLKEELDAQRREKMERLQKEEEERKRQQERLLREREEKEERRRRTEGQEAVEKEERVWRSKGLQVKGVRSRLQEENRREQLRHLLLKQQTEQRAEEEEARRRRALERKWQLSAEARARAVEARLRELRERAAQEEERGRRARLRASLRSAEERARRRVLVRLGQDRRDRAAARRQDRHATRRDSRDSRDRRDQVRRREEAAAEVRQRLVAEKERRRERLRRSRERVQEEAQRLARAASHMRERVRRSTTRRTFNQMVLEAQLAASLALIKL